MSNDPRIPPPSPLDIPIVHSLYEIYAVWHRLVLKFPKIERYALGQTCSQLLLEIIERILAAASIPNKTTKAIYLQQASSKLDTLKLLIRLCKDCDCISNVQYLGLEAKLHHTGKMLGGWIKSCC